MPENERDMPLVYLSLGSNLGDREGFLAMAREAVGKELGKVRFSGVYETEPVEFQDQPWFLNQVAEVRTELSPEEVLERIRVIEAAAGRQRGIPKGPRTLDIDILLFGDAVRGDEELTLPHPRLSRRRHVLVPLVELAPDLRLPGSGLTVAEALAQVEDKTTVRIVAAV